MRLVRASLLVLLVAMTACAAVPDQPTALPTSGTGLGGETIALELEKLERPMLLVFWASWCEPCRAEVPALLALREAHARQIDFLGVSVDVERVDARAFADRYALPYPNVHDPELTFADAIGVEEVPMLVLLGSNGVELARSSHLTDLEPAIRCVVEGRACQ